MTAVTLQLGNFAFKDFEVPEHIDMGGKQMLVTHKFPGGTRVIDAMGPDDDDIVWAGRFRGKQAEARMRQIDVMRQQGQPLTLTWSSLIFVVVIAEFRPRYLSPWEIPYSITCTVLTDPTLQNVAPAPTAADAVVSDLNDASGQSDALGLASVSSALATLQQAVKLAGPLAAASGVNIAKVQSALGGAQAATAAASLAASGNITVSGVAGVVAGGSPAAMALGLTKTSSALTQSSSLLTLGNTLTRLGKNLGNIGN